MSRVVSYRCDRCGREIGRTEYARGTKPQHLNIRDDNSPTSTNVDLCGECFVGFSKWMKGRE